MKRLLVSLIMRLSWWSMPKNRESTSIDIDSVTKERRQFLNEKLEHLLLGSG